MGAADSCLGAAADTAHVLRAARCWVRTLALVHGSCNVLGMELALIDGSRKVLGSELALIDGSCKVLGMELALIDGSKVFCRAAAALM